MLFGDSSLTSLIGLMARRAELVAALAEVDGLIAEAVAVHIEEASASRHWDSGCAARKMGVSVSTAIRWAEKYKIGYIVGGAWRFDPQLCMQHVAAHRDGFDGEMSGI